MSRYYPGVRDSLKLIGIMLLINLSCSILKYCIVGRDKDSLLAGFLHLMIYIITSLGTIFFAVRKMKQHNISNKPLLFKAVKADVVIAGIVVAYSIALLTLPITTLIPMPVIVQKMLQRLMHPNVFKLITAIIVAPILEEILCRGIILTGLLKNYPPAKAIIFSSLIFAVMHFNPWQGIIAFSLGLLLGWLYMRTQSLIPCILVHCANNTTMFVLMKMNVLTSLGNLSKVPAGIEIPALCIIIWAGVWWIDKRTDRYEPEIEPVDEYLESEDFAPEEE